MTTHRLLACAALAGAGLAFGPQAQAVVAYDEAVQGDLSNVGTAPTPIVFGAGDNDLLGVTGLVGPGTAYRDYGSFVVPDNAQLTGIYVLPGTVGAEDGLVFFGLQAGSQVTVNPTTYIGQENLIAWNHFSIDEVGQTLIGQALPLGPGAYSFWIQDYDFGEAPYKLRFTLAVTAVPEPQTYALMGLGLAAVGAAAARRRKTRG